MIPANDIHLEDNTEKGFFDLELVEDGSDLLGAVNLRTSIGISIFTDRRTDDNDSIPNAAGWAGDAIRPEGEDLLGSKMWLFHSEKTLDSNLSRAKQFVEESLQWLLDDNIARILTATVTYLSKPKGIMTILVDVVRFDGLNEKFSYVWNQKLV